MTIQEAIKSGKGFKRKSWPSGFWVDYSTCKRLDNQQFIYTDIIATDWEVLVCEKHKLIGTIETDIDLNCIDCVSDMVGPNSKLYVKQKNCWKTLREVAEEVAAMKGTTWDKAFPFEVEWEVDTTYDGFLVGQHDNDKNGYEGPCYYDSLGRFWNEQGKQFKLKDPCMWSVEEFDRNCLTAACTLQISEDGTLEAVSRDDYNPTGICSKKCSCDMALLLQGGCLCGGV